MKKILYIKHSLGIIAAITISNFLFAQSNNPSGKSTEQIITPADNDNLKPSDNEKMKTLNEKQGKQMMIGNNGEEIFFLADPNYVPQKTDIKPNKNNESEIKNNPDKK